jgi:hypothetical protein
MQSNKLVSVFGSMYEKTGKIIPAGKVLEAIRTGGTIKELIADIRQCQEKEAKTKLKHRLPAIRFSGTFETNTDNSLKEHSGLAILDFDHVEDLAQKKAELMALPFIYSIFISPSGDGIKAIAVIKDGKKHREHYSALMQEIPKLDEKNINPSRICFASYDPDIYINENATTYNKVAEPVQVKNEIPVTESTEIFMKLEKWLAGRMDTFTSGNRNAYIFKLASGCCRAGIDKNDAYYLIRGQYLTSNTDFKVREMEQAIDSAYKRSQFASAVFTKNEFVNKTGGPVELPENVEDIEDIIIGYDVMAGALDLYDDGFKTAEETGIQELNEHFRLKKGELNVLTGIGNDGKSTFWNYLMINKTVKDGTKWAIFSPESDPAEEFYFELAEILLGQDCLKENPARPSREDFIKAYNYICEHFFYVYPKNISPTPEYIKELFLKLIITKKVEGVVIDPFNQMSNDYSTSGGRDDRYLETFLADCKRFAQQNSVYFTIVAHPKTLRKDGNAGYACPDVFDIAGGGMWNNKCDNVLVYYRPERHKDLSSPVSELHIKKIKKQKAVGRPGMITMNYIRRRRGYDFTHPAIETMKFDSREKKYVDFVDKIKSMHAPAAVEYVNKRIESKGSEEDFKEEKEPFDYF